MNTLPHTFRVSMCMLQVSMLKRRDAAAAAGKGGAPGLPSSAWPGPGGGAWQGGAEQQASSSAGAVTGPGAGAGGLGGATGVGGYSPAASWSAGALPYTSAASVGGGSAKGYGAQVADSGGSASNGSTGAGAQGAGAANDIAALLNPALLANRNQAFELFRKSYRQNEVGWKCESGSNARTCCLEQHSTEQ